MSLSVDQVGELLVRTGLLSAQDFASTCADLVSTRGVAKVAQLLDCLEDRGRITKYQRLRLEEGRSEELILGSYTLVRSIGVGGMGEVFKAVHRRMKREVAIKVLPLDKLNSRARLDLFQREIETMAQLSHPNVVMAFDADECDRGTYLVMEFVSGSDLATLVKQRGTLSLRRAVDFITQAARGLFYAHSQQIVHGDVKPANMLINKDGTVKITDLGLARLLHQSSSLDQSGDRTTTKAEVAGTVTFMPPEQAFRPEEVDHRADIYSLGCSLYFLLTGRPLFDEGKVLMTLLAHRDRPRPSLQAACPEAPKELEAIYRRMVAPKAADRFGSMSEVVEALEACPLPETIESGASLLGLGATNADSATLVVDGATTCLSASSLALAELSVLLVEGSRLQTRVISGQMSELGISNLRTAATGQEAWGAMLSQHPDVVVSAMHLSDMTGADLVRRMRSQDEIEAVPFVLISSETDHEFLEPVRQSGTAAILAKPFELSELRQALMAAVDFSPNAVRAHNLRLQGVRVLIVDDSRSARSHLRRVLQSLGCTELTEATNGREAIDLLAKSSFNLIVTDWHMPECDGLELTRHIRQNQHDPNTPVLMITSETDQTLLDDARHTGVTAICSKVFDPQMVAGILNSLLDAARPRAVS